MWTYYSINTGNMVDWFMAWIAGDNRFKWFNGFDGFKRFNGGCAARSAAEF